MNPLESKEDISQGIKPWLIRAVIALFIGLAIDAFVLTSGNPVDNFITIIHLTGRWHHRRPN